MHASEQALAQKADQETATGKENLRLMRLLCACAWMWKESQVNGVAFIQSRLLAGGPTWAIRHQTAGIM